MKPNIKSFFDHDTSTFTHVVSDLSNHICVIIDPVLNYDPKSGRAGTHLADDVIKFIQMSNLKLEWILETHAHADHLSAAQYLRTILGGKIAIGEHILKVQHVFKEIFNIGDEFKDNGSQFDYLLKDEEKIVFGDLSIKCLFVPGHTPACMAYEIGDSIFVGDTLFLPDVGTARCDFPGGDAKTLYKSVKKILSYPDETSLYMCHDYPHDTRIANCLTTVGQERAGNIHIHDGITEEAFVQMRTTRDKTLDMPVLLLPAIQVNIRAGEMPPKESNGTSYLKIPINLL
jgi:glyoxylase-like metal-dependent hydrolase (beta-lactamase superfamily II)